ncbi:TlpA family protein disulfide reductase, partial [bacterium]|nr:TlpA family protein disulfide reductase [bacterium]
NEASVLSVRNSLGGLDVNYELWTIENNGLLTGSKVFEYCDDNKVIIRVISENDTFTDDESMILEDYLSALGALIIFSGKKDDEFYKFPLVKDYILALKDKIAYVRPGDMLKPLNENVFGTRQLKLTEGPLQTTRMLPDAEGIVTNAFTITGQENSYVSLLVSSCTFRLSFFSFHPDRIQISADRDYLIKKCMDYVNISPKKKIEEIKTYEKIYSAISELRSSLKIMDEMVFNSEITFPSSVASDKFKGAHYSIRKGMDLLVEFITALNTKSATRISDKLILEALRELEASYKTFNTMLFLNEFDFVTASGDRKFYDAQNKEFNAIIFLRKYLGLITKLRSTQEVSLRIPEPGTVIKDFEMNDLEGVSQSLGKYIGKKGVILSYWAAWCSTCNDEMPLLQKYFVADGPYQILGGNFKESVEIIQNFKAQHGITFPLIPDPEGKIRKLYRIPTVPVLFFIDKAGVLRHVYRGLISEDDLQKWIEVISAPISDDSEINEELFLNNIINFDRDGLKQFIK